METFIDSNKFQPIKIKLGLTGLFVVDNIGHSGGLALLWKDGTNIDITSYSKNHIDANVRLTGSDKLWRFTGYYGFPDRAQRKKSWQLLKHLASQSSLPWVLMGDCNDILNPEEKRGRCPHPSWLIHGFQEAVNFCGLKKFRV